MRTIATSVLLFSGLGSLTAQAEPTITSSPDFEIGEVISAEQRQQMCEKKAQERAQTALNQQRQNDTSQALETWAEVEGILRDCIDLDDDAYRPKCVSLAQDFYQWTAAQQTPYSAPSTPFKLDCGTITVEPNTLDLTGPDLNLILSEVENMGIELMGIDVTDPFTNHEPFKFPVPSDASSKGDTFAVPQLTLKDALQRKQRCMVQAQTTLNIIEAKQLIELKQAADDLMVKAKTTWEALAPQLEECLSLEDRSACLEKAEAFVNWLDRLKVNLSPGEISVDTDCGPIMVESPKQTRQVRVPEVVNAANNMVKKLGGIARVEGGIVQAKESGEISGLNSRGIHSSAVDVKRRVMPKFPKAVKQMGIRGDVKCTVHFFNDVKGKPEKVEILPGCPTAYHEAILKAAYGWRFHPHKNDYGEAIPTNFRLGLTFRLM